MDLVIERKKITSVKLQQSPVPTSKTLETNHILVKIDKYALTANVISYANAGESLSYFEFFPTSDQASAIVPVWGFADVVASKQEKIPVGTKIYGYFPMSSHLVLNPTNISARSFDDGREHRRNLPPVYNSYTICEENVGFYSKKHEELISILRPLYITSWLLADFCLYNNNFNGQNIIITSASSKTSFGMAFELQELKNKGEFSDCKVIGLTSRSNVEFVENLGLYDEVLDYGNIEKLSKENGSTIFDMSGNRVLLQDINLFLKDELKYICAIGNTHWDSGRKKVPGFEFLKPIFFFAPSQIQLRTKEWSPSELWTRIDDSWNKFIGLVEQQRLIEIEHIHGIHDIMQNYVELADGKVNPKIALICHPEEGSSVAKL
eukprot:augustus_masked-scaffold_16-processed-gene-4.3-mRNA-1 protein AED:1.00 eAED:1.00 QI:0/-1/0/0/-1/1/1/0/377